MIAFTRRGRQRQRRLAASKALREDLVRQMVDVETADYSAHQDDRRLRAAARDLHGELRQERETAPPERHATIALELARLNRLLADEGET